MKNTETFYLYALPYSFRKKTKPTLYAIDGSPYGTDRVKVTKRIGALGFSGVVRMSKLSKTPEEALAKFRARAEDRIKLYEEQLKDAIYERHQIPEVPGEPVRGEDS